MYRIGFKDEVGSLAASARAGDPEAQHRLSHIYIDPELLNNTDKADKWNDAAVKSGNTRTLYTFGKTFFLFKNYEKARLIWELAAEGGHPGAMFNLGPMYMQGQGGSQDFKKGFFWLKKAAERQNPGAIISLAVLYIQGTGVAKDIKKGKALLSELAEDGFLFALEVLKGFNLSSLKKENNTSCPDSFAN